MRISDWSSDVCSSDLDLDALAARWPAWHARLANFLMHDPLSETREILGRIERGIDAPLAQRDLFAAGHDAIVDAGEQRVTSREDGADAAIDARSEEHTSELQSLMRSSYAVFCLK